MDPLTFATARQPDGTVVLSLIGSADITAAAALERQVTLLCAKKPKHVVFDLSRLNFISSLCMGTLVTLARSCKGWQGRATLAAPTPTVAGMFKHARIDVLIPIVDSVDAALTSAGT